MISLCLERPTSAPYPAVLQLCDTDVKWRREETYQLCSAPLGHVASLSTQKFSSNVMEACLERALPEVQVCIACEFFLGSGGGIKACQAVNSASMVPCRDMSV